MMQIEQIILDKIAPSYEENAKHALAKVSQVMQGLPFHMRPRADKALVEVAEKHSFALDIDAAIEKKCGEYSKLEGVAGLKLAAGSDEIKEAAQKLSEKNERSTRNIVKVFEDLGDLTAESVDKCLLAVFEQLAGICKSAGLTPPSLKRTPTQKEIGTACRRMRCEGWLLRQIKKEQRRKLEAFSIRAGFVGKHLSKYVSPQTLADWKERRKRNRSTLEDLEVYNADLNMLMPMLDYDSHGNEIGVFANNAANRRNEMMTRSRGLEEYLKEKGCVALFVTATAPSRFHRWRGFEDNPRYEKATPRESHEWLQTRWQRIRAELGREGVDFAALRTAEPHQDGCAHWHMMLYVKAEKLGVCELVLKDYFIFDDVFTDEAEREQRIKSGLELKRISMDGDESATAYLAKYISKNIDGKGEKQGQLFEVEPADNVQRVLAWASVWGIRQFQFSNGGKVGIWREVRRLISDPKTLPEQVKQVFDAVNSTDYGAEDDASWCDYLKAMEGNPLELAKEQDESKAYGNPIERIKGLLFGEIQLCTRVGEWTMHQKSAPWTCVNNCTKENAPMSEQERKKLREAYKKRAENRNARKKER